LVQYALIKSYAHAEAMGIKPVDSIIGAVIVKKAKPPYKIVGYKQGHTFLMKDHVTFGNLKSYVVEVGGGDFTVFGINPAIAKLIAKDYLRQGARFKIFERKTTFRRV
jgi:hypothetical protein